jgi:tripartite-type tricarboxylate transporter receptor subunit TctC
MTIRCRNRSNAIRPLAAAALFALATAGAAAAQHYPSRPVKIISQGGAGSGPDVLARLVADELGRLWGQQVLVLNHPGATGAIAVKAALAGEPDGYTLFMPASVTYTVLPLTQPDLPFDLDRDFTPVGLISESAMVFTAPPSLGLTSLGDLVTLAKQKPGQVFYAGTVRASLPHLAGEMFASQASIHWTFVPYPGPGQAIQDVLGGRVQVMIENLGSLSGLIGDGKLRPLAVAAPRRFAEFPELPTVAETFPGFEATGWFALVTRAGTPEPIVRQLSRDLKTVLDKPEVRARFQTMGNYVRTMTPAEVTEHIHAEQRKWTPVVKQLDLMAH